MAEEQTGIAISQPAAVLVLGCGALVWAAASLSAARSTAVQSEPSVTARGGQLCR